MGKYRLKHSMALPDCIIAAIVMVTNLEFFTYNQKVFKFIEGLKLFQF